MKNWINSFWCTLFLFLINTVSAQNTVEMADQFRGEGKIYVVVGVVLIILIGIFITLFSIEKKVKRLEEEVNQN